MASTHDDGLINPFPELPVKAGHAPDWKFTVPAGHMIVAQVRPDPEVARGYLARVFDGNSGCELFHKRGPRQSFMATFLLPFQQATDTLGHWAIDVDWRKYRDIGTVPSSSGGDHGGEGGSTTPIGDPNPKGIFNLPFDFHPGDNFSVNIWERNDTTSTLTNVRFHVLVYSTSSSTTPTMVTVLAPPTSSPFKACKNPVATSASDFYAPGAVVPTCEMYLMPPSSQRNLAPGQTLTANLPGWVAGPSVGNLNIQISLLCNELTEVAQTFPLKVSPVTTTITT